MKRMVLILSISFIIYTSSIFAEERAPGTLSPGEIINQTKIAIEELTNLEASALADWEAFERNEEDLARAIEDIKKPLPDIPLSLEHLNDTDPNYLRAGIAKAEEFQKAWEQRQGRRQAATKALAALESLRENLKQTYGPLLDQVETTRPLLIEAQRRIQRRDIALEDFKLDKNAATIDDWIEKSAEFVEQRESLLKQAEVLMKRLEEHREAFQSIPEENPAKERVVRRIQIALSMLAEARAIGDEQRQALSTIREETLPTEVERIIKELQARKDALDIAALNVQAQHKTVLDIQANLKALKTPNRKDIKVTEEQTDLREVHIDVEFAQRMIDYYEQDIALQNTSDEKSKTLVEAIEDSSALHMSMTYQTSRAWAILEHCIGLQQAGKLKTWKSPQGITIETLWREWRLNLIREFERLELAKQIKENLRDDSLIKADQALLEKERENLRRAEANLKTEVSYTEFITEMAEMDQAKLLALLEPTGELSQSIQTIKTKMESLEKDIAQTTTLSLDTMQKIHLIESPFSRIALRNNVEKFQHQKQQIDALHEGQLLPDDQETLIPTEGKDDRSFPEELHNDKDKTAENLATEEMDYLTNEQQFARVFLKYYLDLENQLRSLRTSVEERKKLDDAYEEQINQFIRAEKRRYAAARQLYTYLLTGDLTAEQEPNDLKQWLSRSVLRSADEQLRQTRRANTKFYERSTYELERLSILTDAGRWMKVRSKACDERVELVGRPVSLLKSALTPLDRLDEVERQNLNYDSQEQHASENPLLMRLLLPFSRAPERERYESPLSTYYLELANTHRVIHDLEAATEAYHLMSQACVKEKTDLIDVGPVYEKTLDQRLTDYQMARYAVAVAKHPGQRARIEDNYRKTYGSELPYRLDFHEDNIDDAMMLFASSQARLIGERRLILGVQRLMSKVGLDLEIGWYDIQIARIETLLEGQKSHENELLKRIETLRASYLHFLKNKALTGLGIVLTIPILTFIIVRILRYLVGRFEKRLARVEGEDSSDRKRRLQTLTKTSSAAISVLIWILALIYIFAQLGLDVTPLIASASVMGFALAFGAQALVKDFFYGFFILIENQFTIGDIVALGNITGTVEHITLRITVLRDLQGVVHYIPNGSIGQVSNKTQGWSRVVTEISVPHTEDPDNATRILNEVLHEMAENSNCKYDIIEEPTVAGVENLTERSVDIRIMIKTRPGKQWAVAREARRRIKKRFTELGIEIPFPHRVIHHVYQDKNSSENRVDS